VIVKEQRNILHEIRKGKANWTGHILRRNCLLQWVIEGKIQGRIEVTERQGRRRRKLLDDLKERRGYSHLKEEALDRTTWRARFRGGFGPVVRQTTKWMNEWCGKKNAHLINMFNHILLLFFTNMFPSILWPSPWCTIKIYMITIQSVYSCMLIMCVVISNPVDSHSSDWNILVNNNNNNMWLSIFIKVQLLVFHISKKH